MIETTYTLLFGSWREGKTNYLPSPTQTISNVSLQQIITREEGVPFYRAQISIDELLAWLTMFSDDTKISLVKCVGFPTPEKMSSTHIRIGFYDAYTCNILKIEGAKNDTRIPN